MLTAHQMAQLSPEDRTQLAERLAASIFRTQAEICAALDIALRTWQNWMKDRNAPIMAVLALQSCATAPTKPAALIVDARQIASQLEKAAEAMAEAGRVMASVARRLPDPS